MKFEDTIFEAGLPVNTIAAANRLIELLRENSTNSMGKELLKQDPRIRRLMWFLNAQAFGQLSTIEMDKEWSELYKQFQTEQTTQQVMQ